jgi:predicted O-methyltransferase YrrM
MIKVGILDLILRGYFMLEKPFMTSKERLFYKTLLVDLACRGRLDIFEYGTGYSTLYFAKFLKLRGIDFHIHSIENNREWYEDIAGKVRRDGLERDITLHLKEFTPHQSAPEAVNEFDYINFPKTLKKSFDLIVVDGRFRRRCLECTTKDLLKPMGLVFLHDAERSFYHPPLVSFPFARFIDGGKFYLGEPRQHHVWIGGFDGFGKI